MTLCLLALLFVVLEKLQLGKKNTGDHSSSGTGDLHGSYCGIPGQRIGT